MNVLLGGGIAAQTTVGARILASYLYERRANKSVVNGNSYFVEGFEVADRGRRSTTMSHGKYDDSGAGKRRPEKKKEEEKEKKKEEERLT
ncbi:hypothetical protein VCV18_000774 [Metarhizium anisopliae]